MVARILFGPALKARVRHMWWNNNYEIIIIIILGGME